jgi:hypothetical protein
VTDANELLRQQATQQKQAFEEKFGYPAGEVPGIWVGQYVAVNMLGGRGRDRQLAPTRASGMLEAIIRPPNGALRNTRARQHSEARTW